MNHLPALGLALLLGALGCSEAPAMASDAGSTDTGLSDTGSTDAGSQDVAVVPDDTGPACAPLPTAAPRTGTAPPGGPRDDTLRVHHLQMKATHNSYHLRPARVIPDWDYAMAPLEVQLESQGVRGLELDIRWDNRCGRFRVFHLPVLDDRSTCDLFTDCLGAIRTWSDAHRDHHPLVIQIEPKDSWDAPTTEARMVAMEREILAVFPRELVVTPDEVRGDAGTLAEAVRQRGWPTLAQTRGRVIFAIDRSDSLRDVYTHGGRDLAGRLAFIDSRVGDPFAAVMVLNNPAHADLAAALAANALVRVFAWTAGEAPLDPAEATRAFASGAHLISTDYPGEGRDGGVGLRIPDGTPSRCNPVTAPTGCMSTHIEAAR